jgi:hypothetical protein
MQWLESLLQPKGFGFESFLELFMKTNSQAKKRFKLFLGEQPHSQRKQGLSCPKDQPHSWGKKNSFSLKT